MKKIFLILLVFIANPLVAQKIFTIKDDGGIIYFENWQIKQHVDQCLDGIRMVMDENTGIIISEIRIKNCHLNGIARSYYSNGVIADYGAFLNGLKHGLWYYWKEDGKLIKTEFYEKGILRK
jgi:antitoxin component YwqK of YwqJK toxin-antitoxin module